MKKPWSKIKKGDALDLGGRVWTVEKIKPGKKKAEVKIRHKSNVVRDTVRLDDKVRIAEKPEPPRSRRTAEAAPAKPKKQAKKPPAPAEGDPWETQQDRIEKQLAVIGARLVGEATDADAGYYVPDVDVTTVASHLLVFHGTFDPAEDATQMSNRHALEHEEHLAGKRTFKINHWHTENRPTTGKKKKSKKGKHS